MIACCRVAVCYLPTARPDPKAILVSIWCGGSAHASTGGWSASLSQRDGHEASPRVEPGEPMASVELARSTSSGPIASPHDVGRVVHRLRTLLRSGDAPVGIRNVRARGYSADLTASR
jgi:hypothetical protein